jgi:hypothetical protein
MSSSFTKVTTSLLILWLFLFNLDTASAFDSTDTTPPTVTFQLVQDGTEPSGFVLVKINVKDDQNPVAIEERGYGNFGEYIQLLSSKSGFAPICTNGFGVDRLQIDGFVKAGDSDAYQTPTIQNRNFWLILKAGLLSPLPEGCKEWRSVDDNSHDFKIGLTAIDSAGNQQGIDIDLHKLIGDKWLTSKNQTGVCFTGDTFPSTLDEVGSLYGEISKKLADTQTGVAFLPNLKPFKSQLDKIISPEAGFGATAYSKFSDRGNFNPDSLENLPQCHQKAIIEIQLANAAAALAMLSKDLNKVLAATVPIQVSSPRSTLTANSKTYKPLNCIKGKTLKVMTGANATCPAGFKKH